MKRIVWTQKKREEFFIAIMMLGMAIYFVKYLWLGHL
jgi:hypothetical protein